MQELEKILEEFGSYICDDLCYYRETSADKNDEEMEEICAGCKVGEYLESIRKHINDGWILVEERLPEEPKENPEFKGKKIELYLVAKQGMKYPFRGFWNGKFFTDGWSKCEVIAWRHLPEPYRPESKTGQSDWRADMLRKFDRRSRQ